MKFFRWEICSTADKRITALEQKLAQLSQFPQIHDESQLPPLVLLEVQTDVRELLRRVEELERIADPLAPFLELDQQVVHSIGGAYARRTSEAEKDEHRS